MTTDDQTAKNAWGLPGDASVILSDLLELRGWDKRQGQVDMVAAIHKSLSAPDEQIDVSVNAPVGTGKTLGYLVAALARGKRIVVSTSTKALQDQIVGKELPALAADLKKLYGFDMRYSLLKGKSNYINPFIAAKVMNTTNVATLDLGIEEAPSKGLTAADRKGIKRIIDDSKSAILTDEPNDRVYDSEKSRKLVSGAVWNMISATGSKSSSSISGLTSVEEALREDAVYESPSPELLHTARQELELLAGQPDKPYRAAYAQALTSHIVVLNTSLLAFEVKIGEMFTGMRPTLLNGISCVVVDEAHHAPRILADAFSVTFDTKTIRKIIKAINKKAPGAADLVEMKYHEMLNEIEEMMENQSGEEDLRRDLSNRLDMLRRHLYKVAKETSAKNINEDFGDINFAINNTVFQPIGDINSIINYTDQSGNYTTELKISKENNGDIGVTLVPVDVSFFRKRLSSVMRTPNPYASTDEGYTCSVESDNAVVLSSGTITKNTPKMIGMTQCAHHDVETPFDPLRVRFYVPNIPGIYETGWESKAWAEVRDAIKATNGRTLLVTTSRSKLEFFTERVRREFKQFKVLSQLDGERHQDLIDQFKEDEHSILVGTISFWEGVDVPGPACSLVIMDKLPFPSKDDAIFSARRKYVERKSGSAFMEVDVDHAAIMLAQGSGRLIRSVDDWGGIMLLDNRIITKRYGQQIRKLLPQKWPITQSKEQFMPWLQGLDDARKSDSRIVPDSVLWTPMRPNSPRRGRKTKKV